MFQWFIRFPEFAQITEFNENSTPFRKKSTVYQKKNEKQELSIKPLNYSLTNFLIISAPIVQGLKDTWMVSTRGFSKHPKLALLAFSHCLNKNAFQ